MTYTWPKLYQIHSTIKNTSICRHKIPEICPVYRLEPKNWIPWKVNFTLKPLQWLTECQRVKLFQRSANEYILLILITWHMIQSRDCITDVVIHKVNITNSIAYGVIESMKLITWIIRIHTVHFWLPAWWCVCLCGWLWVGDGTLVRGVWSTLQWCHNCSVWEHGHLPWSRYHCWWLGFLQLIMCMCFLTGRYWDMVERLKINQLYMSTSAVKHLRKCDVKHIRNHDLSSLRTIATGASYTLDPLLFVCIIICNCTIWVTPSPPVTGLQH